MAEGTAAAAPGAILWERAEPLEASSGGGGSGGSPILWQRAELPVDALPMSMQPLSGAPAAPVREAAQTVAPVASSSGTVDLWRVPLDQLRSGAVDNSGDSSSTASVSHSAVPLPEAAPTGNGSAAGGVGDAAAGGGAPAAPPAPPQRQQADALDNAEPAGWPGRIRSGRRKVVVGSGVGGDDE